MRTRTIKSHATGMAMAGGLWAILLAPLAWASAGDELESYLKAQRQQLEDPTRTLAQRARVAMEIAAALDRAALSAPTAEGRRARWAEATAVLDQFNAKEPRHPQKDEFAFQAAVYTWAQAQSWAQQAEQAPSDPRPRAGAIEMFDAAIARLKAFGGNAAEGSGALAQNIRFRLAQAIADRAGIDPGGPDVQRTAREQALAMLDDPFSDPVLQGFAHLLRAELFGKLGRADKAQAALRAAGTVKPPPSAGAMLEVQVATAIERKAFDEAIRSLDQAKVDEAVRDRLAVQVRLAQRAALPSGPGRTAAEADAFRRAEGLRRSGKPESRLALLALARAMEEPGEGQGPEAWDLLAEGHLALGDAERASALELKGADKAEARGRADLAATLRNRAGAILFQAGQFARAEPLLTRVYDDPQAGPIRPKAGLLRILARSRGLAQGDAGFTRDALLDALKAQIRDFPDDSTAHEARWMLGKLRLEAGEGDEAIALWSAIPHGGSHWLEARLAVAQIRQDALDTQLINGDRVEARRRLDEARRHLEATLDSARDASDQAAIELTRARLELTPVVGQPEIARQICDRLLKSASLAEQRDRAMRLRIVALAQLGRFVDAERDARSELGVAPAGELLTLARLLDRSASATDSDLFRRRFGQIMRILTTKALDRAEGLSPGERSEAQLRQTRALLFGGNFDGARKSLEALRVTADSLDDVWLDDLADTYVRLDAHIMAVDVFRLRGQQTRPGSLPWFGARYGLAMAYYRSGRRDEARRIIDATAILHPELGGGELRGKFERLRQRLFGD